MKSVLVSALVVMTPVASLFLSASDATAQVRQSSSSQELSDRPADDDEGDPEQPVEFSTVEPTRQEQVNDTGSEMPADNPWIMHCLTEHDAGEDIDNCLNDGGL